MVQGQASTSHDLGEMGLGVECQAWQATKEKPEHKTTLQLAFSL